MPKYVVPIITSYYEYIRVEADTEDEAIALVNDGGGDDYPDWSEFREVIAIGHDAGEVTILEDDDG